VSWTYVLYKFNPAVPRNWLLVLAGLLWTSVGFYLCFLAYGWLNAIHDRSATLYGASGILVAFAWSRLMFGKTATKSVNRISLLPERTCLFAFTAWRGYAMITVMIATGILLRNSALPRQYLAALYIAMGGALFLSSFVFYRSYWSEIRRYK
jgi:hypothetical protein